jgi:prophage antirepressor-like protein
MNELQIFNSPEFGQVRTVQLNSKTYFVGIDVATALEYANPSKAIINHCKGVTKLGIPSQGGTQETNVIPEGDIYRLVIKAADQSRSQKVKEKAERFENWVFDEVLPSIRKTGTYQPSMLEIAETQLKAIKEVHGEVKAVDEDLQNFKRDMPILGIEESIITTAVKRMGVKCLGGKNSQAYQDNSLRTKVFSDIHRQLKREFGVTTYKAIKRSQVDKAIEVIEAYELPTVLWEQVVDTNSQIAM